MRRTPNRTPYVVKESPILQHVLDYLAWEKVWRIRLTTGVARVGGQPVRLPQDIVLMILALREVKGKKWDRRIRLNEKWVSLAERGTPDVLFMLPGNRKVLNEASQTYEKFPCARIGFIETKTTKGRLNDDQKKFRALVIGIGGLHYVVRSPEDLRRYLPPRMELNFVGVTA